MSSQKSVLLQSLHQTEDDVKMGVLSSVSSFITVHSSWSSHKEAESSEGKQKTAHHFFFSAFRFVLLSFFFFSLEQSERLTAFSFAFFCAEVCVKKKKKKEKDNNTRECLTLVRL